MLDADAVINNSSQKVGGSNAYPDPAAKKVGGSGRRKTHRIYTRGCSINSSDVNRARFVVGRGLNDKNSDGDWRYDAALDSAPVRYFNWRHNFPRKMSRDRHCVQVNRAGEWINRPCDKSRSPFICSQRRQNRRRRA